MSEYISCLTKSLRNLHETRQTTTNDINVLLANSQYGTNEPSGQPAPASDSQPKVKKLGKRKFDMNQSSRTANTVTTIATQSSTHQKGMSRKGSESWMWTDAERQSWGFGGKLLGSEPLTPTAMLIGKEQ